nr:hypothetical protein [uncultured Brevundimonas sp.]
MSVGSVTQGAYTHRFYTASQTPPPASTSEVAASPKASSEPVKAPSLFSNGQFIGQSALTNPSTLAELFQLNEDGTVKVSDLGSPVTKQGVFIETPQDSMTKFLMLGTESTWTEADKATAADLSKITDDDKALFRAVTGYNLFISGPAMLMVDDQGNSPSPTDAAAADELFQRMKFARETDQSVSLEWFNNVAKDIEAWKGPVFPSDWMDKADAWFGDMLASRQDAFERREFADAGSISPSATQLSSALDAYEDAARLSDAA